LDGFIVLYDLARLAAKKLVSSIGGAIWCMTKNKSETKIVVGTEDGYVVMYEMQLDGLLFEKSFNKQDCMCNLFAQLAIFLPCFIHLFYFSSNLVDRLAQR
jgi:hypothetical protein